MLDVRGGLTPSHQQFVLNMRQSKVFSMVIFNPLLDVVTH